MAERAIPELKFNVESSTRSTFDDDMHTAPGLSEQCLTITSVDKAGIKVGVTTVILNPEVVRICPSDRTNADSITDYVQRFTHVPMRDPGALVYLNYTTPADHRDKPVMMPKAMLAHVDGSFRVMRDHCPDAKMIFSATRHSLCRVRQSIAEESGLKIAFAMHPDKEIRREYNAVFTAIDPDIKFKRADPTALAEKEGLSQKAREIIANAKPILFQDPRLVSAMAIAEAEARDRSRGF